MDWQNPYDNDRSRGSEYGRNSEYGHGSEYGRGSEYSDGSEYGQRPRDGGAGEDVKKLSAAVRRCFSRVGIVYLVFLMVSIASQWLALVILETTGLADGMGWNLYMVVSMFSMYPVAVPLTGLLVKWAPSVGQTGRERWGAGKLAGFFVFSMGVLYAGNMVGLALTGVAGLIKGEPIANDMQELITSMSPEAIILSAVIVAPVMEELVFRKFLLDRIAGYGHWTAMAVSAVIFGIAHGNFYQFFYAFGLGLIFAYIYLHTGKIGYTIAFHMIINFWGSILPMGLLKIAEINGVLGGILAIGNMMMMFGFMICALVLFLCCRRDLYFEKGLVGLPAGKKNRAVWLNGGMVLFLLCGAVTLARSL